MVHLYMPVLVRLACNKCSASSLVFFGDFAAGVLYCTASSFVICCLINMDFFWCYWCTAPLM